MSSVSLHSVLSSLNTPELAEPVDSLRDTLSRLPPASLGILPSNAALGGRDVVYLGPSQIFLIFNNSARGDDMIGAGTNKRVFKALELTAQKVVACAVAKLTPALEGELMTRASLEGTPLLQKAPLGVLKPQAGAEAPLFMFEHLYHGDMLKLYKTKPSDPELLSSSQKQKLFKELLLGLKNLHEKGLLHRDIKPANVFIDQTEDGVLSAHLSDFGEAVHEGDREAMIRRAGSPEFFSPEYLEYQSRPLEIPARKAELALEKTRLEMELVAIIQPGASKLSPKALFDFQRANPEHPEVARITEMLKDIKAEILGLSPCKDFSQVTTRKHDLYALGLTLLGLVTSQDALATILSSNRALDFKDVTHDIFEGYEVSKQMQDVLLGLLKKDPAERFSWRELDPFLS